MTIHVGCHSLTKWESFAFLLHALQTTNTGQNVQLQMVNFKKYNEQTNNSKERCVKQEHEGERRKTRREGGRMKEEGEGGKEREKFLPRIFSHPCVPSHNLLLAISYFKISLFLVLYNN